MSVFRSHQRSFPTRRDVMAVALGGVSSLLGTALVRGDDKPQPAKLKGRIRQAVAQQVLSKMTIEQKCQVCVQLGLYGMDGVKAADWATLKKHGLICTLASAGVQVLNRKEAHPQAVDGLRKAIEAVAEAGFPSVKCGVGNRVVGLSDEEAAANCAEALKQIAAFAEEKKINVCFEMYNSKRDHPNYQCDSTAWGVEVCKKVGSPRVKLIYDVYHMQVQEGDVIATIRENIEYFAHFHAGGVPGKHEIDETQELYYPAIMRAIADLKFEGYVAHEFRPTRDPVKSLKQAVAICDV